MYYVLIGDIVHSKKLSPSERFELQRRLRVVFDKIHLRFSSVLAAKFQITLGDEFQAVMKNSSSLFEICLMIRTAIWPQQARFVIGIDELYTSFGSEFAIDIDGPAFWGARNVMNDEAFKHPRGPKLRQWTKISGSLPESSLDLANASLVLADNVVASWKEEHINIIRAILELYGFSEPFKQIDLAKRLSIGPDVLNRKLKTMKYFDLVPVYRAIEKALAVKGESE